MLLQQFLVPGLGCFSYLIGCDETGVAAVVDPQRDVRPYLEEAQRQGLRITHVIETHLHADHVSGYSELAWRTGARVYFHTSAEVQVPHQKLADGDVLHLGRVLIQAQHTPGHTPESILLLVSDTARSQEPWLALTGDLLMVGDAGRPDLVETGPAGEMAEQLYASLFTRVGQLDDSLLVYPGHGAGSLCGRALGGMTSTTVGFEKRNNPALLARSPEDFFEYMTRQLPEQPGSYHLIKMINRIGPRLLGEARPAAILASQAFQLQQNGAVCLDTRSKDHYLRGHLPGSVHLPADDQLSSRASFVLDPELPIFLLLEDETDWEPVFWSLARVGCDRIIGHLAGGIWEWEQAGFPVVSGDVREISPAGLNALLTNGQHPQLVDVREPWEAEAGQIEQAILIPLDQLARRANELDPARPVVVLCALGSRSQIAGSILWRKGFSQVYILTGGMYGWEMAGFPVVVGKGMGV